MTYIVKDTADINWIFYTIKQHRGPCLSYNSRVVRFTLPISFSAPIIIIRELPLALARQRNLRSVNGAGRKSICVLMRQTFDRSATWISKPWLIIFFSCRRQKKSKDEKTLLVFFFFFLCLFRLSAVSIRWLENFKRD